MKLVDLPIGLLSSIAALVCLPSYEDEVSYPLQVTCRRDEWLAFNGMRSSSRLLRDATRLAVSGLKNVGIALPEGKKEAQHMPFATASTLPFLAKLVDVHGPGLPRLARVLPKGLTCISIYNHEKHGVTDDLCNETCDVIALHNSNDLEIVTLNRVVDAAAKALLASLSGKMKELTLMGHVGGETLLLSKEAAMSIRTAVFRISKVDALLLQIFESPSLSSLTLELCSFADAGTLKQLPKAVNLRKIEFFGDRRGGYTFEKVLATGALKSLEELVYFSANDQSDLNDKVRMITSMLMGVRHGLRRLYLSVFNYLDEANKQAIVSVPLRPDCEVKLTLRDGP